MMPVRHLHRRALQDGRPEIAAGPLAECVTLAKSLPLARPQSPHLYHQDTILHVLKAPFQHRRSGVPSTQGLSPGLQVCV